MLRFAGAILVESVTVVAILYVHLPHQKISVYEISLSVPHGFFEIALIKHSWYALKSCLSMVCLPQEDLTRKMIVLGHKLA
jgi:hypothetical protein